jgi:hypothetical protein
MVKVCIQDKRSHEMCNHCLDFDDLLNFFQQHFTIDQCFVIRRFVS